MSVIVFTGGGTAGHVAPNLALIPEFQKKGWDIAYIGSTQGIEKEMIKPLNIPFYGIQSGKLRRYFSVKNFLDPFKILIGVVQAFFILFKIRPKVVFSKGGFVAFPVVFAAWLNRIPVIAHESDLSPGLANRLCIPFIKVLCLTFEAGKKHFKTSHKVVVTGTPIREQLFKGNRLKGLEICGFIPDKKNILIIGGSMGANSINRSIRELLPRLTETYQIAHICGKGKCDNTLNSIVGYKQFEYINNGLEDLFAMADLIISRSGANSLYEILALKKPHILIPLSSKVSRGDQIQNANYFEQIGVSRIIKDENLNSDILFETIQNTWTSHHQIEKLLQQLNIKSGIESIVKVIEEQVHVESAATV